MWQTFIVNALVILIFMTLAWLVARLRKRLDTVDSAWGLGFVALAATTLMRHSTSRQWLLTALVVIWGVRLTYHLAARSARRGQEDPRYAEMAAKWGAYVWLRAYFVVFLLQGALVWTISLPIMITSRPAYADLSWINAVGALVWLAGFCTEAIADKQLARFLQTKNSKNDLLDSGLWRYSRHPNYFGELTQWFGIGIIALQVSYGWVGLLGPLMLGFLIIFVSGIPPIEKRRLNNPAYQAYKRRTSALVPLPPRPH